MIANKLQLLWSYLLLFTVGYLSKYRDSDFWKLLAFWSSCRFPRGQLLFRETRSSLLLQMCTSFKKLSSVHALSLGRLLTPSLPLIFSHFTDLQCVLFPPDVQLPSSLLSSVGVGGRRPNPALQMSAGAAVCAAGATLLGAWCSSGCCHVGSFLSWVNHYFVWITAQDRC